MTEISTGLTLIQARSEEIVARIEALKKELAELNLAKRILETLPGSDFLLVRPVWSISAFPQF